MASQNPLDKILQEYVIEQKNIRGEPDKFNVFVYVPEPRKIQQEKVESNLKKSKIEYSRMTDRGLSRSSDITVVYLPKLKKAYQLIFKPQKGVSTSATGAVKIPLKPSQIITKTNILLKTKVPDEKIRAESYGKKVKGKWKLPTDDNTALYPIEIVNQWLTPEQMITRTKLYLKQLNLPEEILKEFSLLLSRTLDGQSRDIQINIEKSPAAAEFFEVLSAIKLAALMRAQNTYIIDEVLFLPKEDKKLVTKKDIKIYIPKAPNYPLLDYFISYNKITGNQAENEKKALKVSVKAKISSPTVQTNTVKFQDLFSSEQKVIEWYSDVSIQEKKTQLGPKEIALSAAQSQSAMSAALYPIAALEKLLKGNTQSNQKKQITATLRYFGKKRNTLEIKKFGSKNTYTDKEIDEAFIRTIKLIGPKVKTYSKDKELSEILSDKTDLFIMTKVFQQLLTTSTFSADKVKISIENLNVICERILSQGSKPLSDTRYNFYKMFYDQVLERQKIVYAMPTRYGTTLKYKFFAVKNWNKEYEEIKKVADRYWMSLRGKSSTNNVADAMGIDI